jgi:hypothetical protein
VRTLDGLVDRWGEAEIVGGEADVSHVDAAATPGRSCAAVNPAR